MTALMLLGTIGTCVAVACGSLGHGGPGGLLAAALPAAICSSLALGAAVARHKCALSIEVGPPGVRIEGCLVHWDRIESISLRRGLSHNPYVEVIARGDVGALRVSATAAGWLPRVAKAHRDLKKALSMPGAESMGAGPRPGESMDIALHMLRAGLRRVGRTATLFAVMAVVIAVTGAVSQNDWRVLVPAIGVVVIATVTLWASREGGRVQNAAGDEIYVRNGATRFLSAFCWPFLPSGAFFALVPLEVVRTNPDRRGGYRATGTPVQRVGKRDLRLFGPAEPVRERRRVALYP